MAVESVIRRRLVLAAILLAAFAVRWPFRHVLLVRDEAEYVLAAREILLGALPYVDVYNQKTPFVFYLIAMFRAIGGESVAALRIATALWAVLTTAALYALARRFLGTPVALAAAAVFVVLTFAQCVVEYSASPEYFMSLWVIAAVAGCGLAHETGRLRYWLLGGVAAGLAYQTKQLGASVLIYLVASALWSARPAARAVLAALGGFAGVLVTVLGLFAWAGGLAAYVECTIVNNVAYVGSRAGFWGDPIGFTGEIATTIAGTNLGLWILGAAGTALLAARGKSAVERSVVLLLVAMLASSLSAGQTYRQYYDALPVPLALGAGYALTASWRLIRSPKRATIARVGAAVACGVVLAGPAYEARRHLLMTEEDRAALLATPPPFAGAPEIAAFVGRRTMPEDRILVVGSEPEIYVYADRRPATRLVFTYPITGPYPYARRLLDEFLSDLRRREPRIVVVMMPGHSRTEFPGLDRDLMDGVRGELAVHYALVAKLPEADPTAWIFERDHTE